MRDVASMTYLGINHMDSPGRFGIESSCIEISNRGKPLMSNRVLGLTRREEQLTLGVQVQILAVFSVGDDDEVRGVNGGIGYGAEDAAHGEGPGNEVGGLVGPEGQESDD